MSRVFVLFSIFYSIHSISAELPPRWRMEYNYGRANTTYIEKQSSILFSDTNIEQEADYHKFIYQYLLVPNWLDFSLGIDLTGLNIDEPKDTSRQFMYFTGYANLGLMLPLSDFWSVKLVAETFYTSMEVEDDSFGFRNLTGNQFYPEIEWLPFGTRTRFQFSPYLKIPIANSVGNRRETTAGLKFLFPIGREGERKFPTFAYQKAVVVRIFYTHLTLEFERENFISSEIEVKQLGAILGFNF